nr:PR domain zinc finger protein 12-like [Rhipicephalus microplus]
MAGTPRQLRLGVSSVPGCQVGVFACDLIPKDTQMGPYPGARKPAVALCRDPSLVWEAIDGGRVCFLVDGADTMMPSWMTYVQCARHEQEQNLDMLLLPEGSLYYRVTKDH